MTYPYFTDTAGRRYEQPAIFNPTPSTGIMGVWLNEDEEVDWTIITNPDGSQHCCGYTIRKKNTGELVNELAPPTIQPLKVDPITLQICNKPAAGEINVKLDSNTLDELGF